MALRIDPGTNELYNTNKVGLSDEALRAEQSRRIEKPDEPRLSPSLSAEELLSLSRGNRGVVQTKVSPENSFQKAMVHDKTFAYERMAAKLMDKLPRILDDMQKLTAEDNRDVITAAKRADANKGPEKVVISEASKVPGQAAPVPETEDISL